MDWILVIYRLPANDSRARVAIWRELRRSGAHHLQQSVVAVPDTEAFVDDIARLREVLADIGGQLTVLRAQALADGDDARVIEAWNEAREDEYRELAAECAKFLAEIDKEFLKEKFTPAELDEEEADLDKLQRWHGRIAKRDVHQAPGGPAAASALRDAEAALARYADAVFEHSR
jgi:DNA-binding transcriptional regulator PaaX